MQLKLKTKNKEVSEHTNVVPLILEKRGQKEIAEIVEHLISRVNLNCREITSLNNLARTSSMAFSISLIDPDTIIDPRQR